MVCAHEFKATRFGVTRPTSSLSYSSLPAATRSLGSRLSIRSSGFRQPLSRRSGPSVVCYSCFCCPRCMDVNPLWTSVSSRRDLEPICARIPRVLSSFNIHDLPMKASTMDSTLNPLFDQRSIEVLNRLVTEIVQQIQRPFNSLLLCSLATCLVRYDSSIDPS